MLLLYLSLLAFYLFYKNGTKNNNKLVCSLYVLIWIVVGGLSTLGLYGIEKPSFKIHIAVIVSIFFFVFGTIIGNRISFKSHLITYNTNTDGNGFDTPCLYRKKLLSFFVLIAWGICLLYLPRTIRLINSVGYYDLRYFAYHDSDKYMSTVELLFFQCVVQPLIISSNVIYIVDAVRSRKYKLFVPIVISTFFYSFMFGGRGIIIIDLIVLALVLFQHSGQKITTLIKKHRKFVFLGVLVVAILVYLISLRKYEGYSVFRTIYVYIVGPLSFWDNLWTAGRFPSQLMGGRLLFGSATSLLDYFILIFVNRAWLTGAQIVNSITQEFQYIGNIRFNALTTYLYPAMCDYGIVGIGIYPLVVGAVSSYIEKQYHRNTTMLNTVVYFYMTSEIITLIMNYGFMTALSGMVFVFFILFCAKVKSD